jgi:hypothetical protein
MTDSKLHPISTFDLEWYHFGRLNAGQNLRIRKHLDQCKECTERLEAVERFVLILGSGTVRGAFCEEVGLLNL